MGMYDIIVYYIIIIYHTGHRNKTLSQNIDITDINILDITVIIIKATWIVMSQYSTIKKLNLTLKQLVVGSLVYHDCNS